MTPVNTVPNQKSRLIMTELIMNDPGQYSAKSVDLDFMT